MKRWIGQVKKGCIPTNREQTYKSKRAFERAYYKFICKMNWFSNIKDGKREPIPNFSGGYFEQGYPSFRAWRSEAYRQFIRSADDFLEEWQERDKKEKAALWDKEWKILSRSRERVGEVAVMVDLPWWVGSNELGLDSEEARNINPEWIEVGLFYAANRALINRAKKPKKTHRP